MQLSQGVLNLLSTCPRKFQYVYLDQLAVPMPLEQQERLAWGKWFHLLMQQHVMGLPFAALPANPMQTDEQLIQQSVDRFINEIPALWQASPDITRQSEHCRTLYYQGHLLTVIYDLLILQPDQAQILDWKTYPRPLKADRLIDNWQTQLYLFVLVQTSHYKPEQISMTYWFVHQDQTPQSLRLDYSSHLYQQTQQKLTAILNQLDRWLEAYQQGCALPQTGKTAGHCDRCTFHDRCQQETSDLGTLNLARPDISGIVEQPL